MINNIMIIEIIIKNVKFLIIYYLIFSMFIILKWNSIIVITFKKYLNCYICCFIYYYYYFFFLMKLSATIINFIEMYIDYF